MKLKCHAPLQTLEFIRGSYKAGTTRVNFGRGPGYHDQDYVPSDATLRNLRQFVDARTKHKPLLVVASNLISVLYFFDKELSPWLRNPK